MPQLTIQQTFDLAIQHHQSGRLAAAEPLYREILAQQPDHADSLRMLGVLAHQAGRNDLAVDWLRRAIAIKPDWPEACYDLGVILQAGGQLDQAIAAYRQAIARKADYPEAYGNLGVALKAKGCLDEAIAAYRQALALKPNHPKALNNLAMALQEKGQLDQAIAAYHQAIALVPNHAEAYYNLGTALQAAGQLDQAIAAWRQTLIFKPNYPEALNNLGVAMTNQGQLDQAIAACRQAIAVKPNFAGAYYNLGVALANAGQLAPAIAAFQQAIALVPDYAEAHCSLALALLVRGDLAQGWEEYEWRLAVPAYGAQRGFPQRQWDGSDPAGKTILLHPEGALGDALQFVRFVPMMQGRGARLILECPPPLLPLFASMTGIDQCVARGQPLPPFDWHCPLQSLPRIFRITLDNIPNAVPYLFAPKERVRRWAARVPTDGQLNVGLVWAGSVGGHRWRSQTVEIFQPLAALPGVRFFSLQKGPAATQAPPDGLHLIDYTAELHDFADTAALVQQLDLVITVDTSMAHLAGALAKPVWVLIPAISDFRWLLERTDSPWYPTMRLFRQPCNDGQWGRVTMCVAQALSVWRGHRR